MSTRLQPALRLSRKTGVPALSWLATLIAVVALAVSLTHHGPPGARGLQGPQGDTGRNATVAHLGVCEQDSAQWIASLSNYAPGQYAYDPPLITAPVLTSGVPSCPAGSFVSIVPGG